MPQQIPYCRERAGAVLGGSWGGWVGEGKYWNENRGNNVVGLLIVNLIIFMWLYYVGGTFAMAMAMAMAMVWVMVEARC